MGTKKTVVNCIRRLKKETSEKKQKAGITPSLLKKTLSNHLNRQEKMQPLNHKLSVVNDCIKGRKTVAF
ncbi:hypothetical protein C7N43_27085 [Sphingobacteriales bacterium UPWRP_1]|nr:hypothetical protein BVG80_15720 [Sphingobacteriales bacterium TSM_CSM]PSJ73848.1 hypothetical protein C7N43_27085 [Sphingobacteriales bacterium UPWRP_1]